MSNRSLFGWFKKHGQMAQVLASIVTALVALAALIGVKVQIDAAARSQQEQSAREIYREFLNLSIGNPQFAEPDLLCVQGHGAGGGLPELCRLSALYFGTDTRGFARVGRRADAARRSALAIPVRRV